MTKVKNTRRKRAKPAQKRPVSKPTRGTTAKPATKAAPMVSPPQRHPIAYKALGSDKQDTPVLPPIRQTPSWDLVKPSIRLWWQNKVSSIVLFVLPSVLLVVGLALASTGGANSTRTYLGVGLLAIAYLWLLVNLPAVYYLQVRAVRGKTPGLLECYGRGIRLFPKLVGLLVLIQVVVLIGLILLIVPGLILLRRYILAPYYLIDHNLGIRQAMQRSAADSKPVSWSVWGVYGVYFVLSLASSLVLGQLFKPYGSLAAAIASSLYIFGPALRYKEVALRQPATEGLLPAQD